ncbi:MAG: MOSC domain-containing protein [Alphaproteobacteria bacterium]
MIAKLSAIYRYPVKGLSPEKLDRAHLTAGAYFPGDRLFAIENGPSGFDAAAPVHQPKTKYLMLMRDERLATLRTRYEDATGTISIEHEGRCAVHADLAAKEGRLAVEAFFRRFMPHDLRGPPKMLAAPEGYRFTDSRSGFVSLINLASVAELETLIGVPVNPLRFRANLYVRGWTAWSEFNLVDREFTVGPVRLKGLKRITRCAAINVDPDTGVRDLTIPTTLMQNFDHMDCGIYARVIEGGDIAAGDSISL